MLGAARSLATETAHDSVALPSFLAPSQVTGESSWQRPADFKGDVERVGKDPVPVSAGAHLLARLAALALRWLASGVLHGLLASLRPC